LQRPTQPAAQAVIEAQRWLPKGERGRPGWSGCPAPRRRCVNAPQQRL